MANRIFALLFVFNLGANAMAQPVLRGIEKLPDVRIDGKVVKIHTQGLYVTPEHYYVTGRLELKPKRALLLRFERSGAKAYEYIDITPAHPNGKAESPDFGNQSLDHPGGMDEGEGFLWIPVGLSQPKGPTVVFRIKLVAEEPLAKRTIEKVMVVDDHIGAICYEPTMGLLYGANWDTKNIYAWETDGRLKKKIDRAQLIKDDPGWALAVQDWKGVGTLFSPGVIVAGGLLKPKTKSGESKAVIEFIDPVHGKSLNRMQVPTPKGVTRPVTNEGLAFHGNEIFLLPEDLGKGARILRYAMPRSK